MRSFRRHGAGASDPTLADQRAVLDLEGYVNVEEDEGGSFALFEFPGALPEPFARVSKLPAILLLEVVAVGTAQPTKWPFVPDRVGGRVFGEAPNRTISNWKEKVRVFLPDLRNWAILVINGQAELFVRMNALPPRLRTAVKGALESQPS